MLCSYFTTVFSQYNPGTNTFSSSNEPVVLKTVEKANVQNFSQLSGIPCNQNTFWATSSGVDEYVLVGATTVFVSTVCTPLYYNLAYCNNLNGGSFSPTFYDAIDSNAAYYDGAAWNIIALNGPGRLFNCGGNGSFLYYCVAPANSYPKSIARYDGVAFTNIYTLPDTNQFISVADLDVDDAGNVWFFTGFPVAPYNSDTLNVVSPSGQLIKQFPFSYNTLNAYGSFILNGVIYIGLGSANTFHPNTLIPVTISSTSATAGTPISMPPINYADLASCNPGMPLSVNENHAPEILRIFPNPAHDVIMITSKNKNKNEYRIVDVNGRVMQLISLSFGNVKAAIHSLCSGVYFIELINSKEIFRTKFVKQ